MTQWIGTRWPHNGQLAVGLASLPLAETGRSSVEEIKAASRQLRGGLGEELADAAPAFSQESYQLLKFHGVYQQDDRMAPPLPHTGPPDPTDRRPKPDK